MSIHDIPLKSAEEIVKEGKTAFGETMLTVMDKRYYFYLNTTQGIQIREADPDVFFDLTHMAKWTVQTMSMSKKKQRMRIPAQHIMRAVGFQPNDISLFLDNETKNGFSAKLRQLPWYQNTHPEIQTAAIKLFAHLGLFEQSSTEYRLSTIDKVLDAFSLLEIHNLFGGLPSGISLSELLAKNDRMNNIDIGTRKRFDPTGKKAISFFLDNISNPDFKDIACYALTHYVPELASYSSQQKTANAMLESNSAQSDDKVISEVANSINLKHEEIANTLYAYHNGNKDYHDRILELQNEMESLRKKLHNEIEESNHQELNDLLENVRLSRKPFSIEHFQKHHAEVCFPNTISSPIVQSAIKSGYKSCDWREVTILDNIYRLALTAEEKVFVLSTIDREQEGLRYVWLKPDNPTLYTIAMLCGNTCMRPGFAGEAALWESALSPDVAMAAIEDSEKIIAYFRINYDSINHGFYIDTVESRYTAVLNSEEVWNAVRRSVIDMANAMNKDGTNPVKVITYREERGNRLKNQWNNLPPSRVNLIARAYSNPNCPWAYGDNNARIQKEVWFNEQD